MTNEYHTKTAADAEQRHVRLVGGKGVSAVSYSQDTQKWGFDVLLDEIGAPEPKPAPDTVLKIRDAGEALNPQLSLAAAAREAEKIDPPASEVAYLAKVAATEAQAQKIEEAAKEQVDHELVPPTPEEIAAHVGSNPIALAEATAAEAEARVQRTQTVFNEALGAADKAHRELSKARQVVNRAGPASPPE